MSERRVGALGHSREGAGRRRRARTALASLTAVLVALLLVVPATGAAAAPKVRRSYFGMHDGRLADIPDRTADPAVGSLRLWDTFTMWRQIETRDGHFKFARVDAFVAAAERGGDKAMLVLGQTPRFHARHPHAPGFYGAGASSMPRLAAWRRYVGKVAKRYRSTIEYQIWNEPNVDGFWRGSPAQMALLTRIATQKIRSIAPRATIVSPPMPLRLKSQRKWFVKYWSQRTGGRRVGSYVDVASVNPYPMAAQRPEQSLGLTRWAKRTLSGLGVRKPLWVTEINYGMGSGTAPLKIRRSVQAAYVVRTHLLQAAAGVKRVYWYRWDMRGWGGVYLTRPDLTTPTQAGVAYRVVRGWLVGARLRGCSVSRGGVHTCTLARDSRVQRVYWKPTGGSTRLKVVGSATTLVTQLGEEKALRGGQRITVTRLPVLVRSRR